MAWNGVYSAQTLLIEFFFKFIFDQIYLLERNMMKDEVCQRGKKKNWERKSDRERGLPKKVELI